MLAAILHAIATAKGTASGDGLARNELPISLDPHNRPNDRPRLAPPPSEEAHSLGHNSNDNDDNNDNINNDNDDNNNIGGFVGQIAVYSDDNIPI